MNNEHQVDSRRTERVRRVGAWARRELGDALLCAVSVYLGVLSSTLLPAGALALLPWPELPVAGLVLSPLAAIPLAARVFDTRGWPRWQAGRRAPLGVRVLRALSDGVLWLRWWRDPP